MNTVHIETLTPENEQSWTHFVENTEGCTFFHTLQWKEILERTYHLKSHYFMVFDDAEVVAICPFFISKLATLKGLKSLPMSNYHSVVIKTSEESIYKVILERCTRIATEHGLTFIQLTTSRPETIPFLDQYRPIPIPLEGTMVLDLKLHPPETIWNDLFKAEDGQRKYIKRITKEGFLTHEGNKIEDVRTFYEFYSANLLSKHVPPLPWGFFQITWEVCPPEQRRLVLVQRNTDFLAGLYSFIYEPQSTVYLEHMAINRDFPGKFHPSFYLFWEAIEYAFSRNFRYVCFGGAPKNPTDYYRKQKLRFGCQYEEQSTYAIPLTLISRILLHTAVRLKK